MTSSPNRPALEALAGAPAPEQPRVNAEGASAVRPVGSRRLRVLLALLDATAVAVAWTTALLLGHGAGPGILWPRWAYAIPSIVAVSLGLLASQGLYRARMSSVRATELARLVRVGLIAGVVVLAAAKALGLPAPTRTAVVGAALSVGALAAVRGWYHAWLRSARRQGRFLRPVVIIGANEEGLSLSCLVRDHPELGLKVCGIMGRSAPGESGLDAVWLGDPDDVVTAARKCGANGALIACSALSPSRLNRLIRDLVGGGIHVHLSNGLRGIDHRRLQATSFAHEPLFYLEPASLARWQLVVKRALDLVLAPIALVVSLPVVLVAAVAIKLQDGGPVLIRQRRIGRHGKPFTMLKLRTMVPNAEKHLPALAALNGRDGPLFKAADDPRVTRVGKFLRASSIDELLQLLNVVQGTMSLVGPRPALPDEVASFDEELRAREQLPPGITGLWQVEARDNPSFAVYRRLDLFYIENWSVRLDLTILTATVQVVAGRAIQALRRRSPGEKEPSVAVFD